MAVLMPWIKSQFFDNNGVILSSGQIQTYAAGTTTPQSTFTDSTGSTANSNPVVLDSAGRANIWLTPGLSYKMQVMDASSNILYTEDNVVGPSTPGFTPVTISYTQVQTAATSNAVPLFSLPAMSMIKNIVVKHSTSFSGGSLSAVTVQIGPSNNFQQLIENFDVFQSVGDSAYDNETLNYIGSWASSVQIYANFVGTGANLSALTQGSLTVYYESLTV